MTPAASQRRHHPGRSLDRKILQDTLAWVGDPVA